MEREEMAESKFTLYYKEKPCYLERKISPSKAHGWDLCAHTQEALSLHTKVFTALTCTHSFSCRMLGLWGQDCLGPFVSSAFRPMNDILWMFNNNLLEAERLNPFHWCGNSTPWVSRILPQRQIGKLMWQATFPSKTHRVYAGAKHWILPLKVFGEFRVAVPWLSLFP